jgi:hypothetical protein
MSHATVDDLTAAHARLLELALAQQEADLAAGLAPSLRVDTARLDGATQAELAELLRHAAGVGDVVRAALALV